MTDSQTYFHRIQQVVDHIRQHLYEDLSLSQLAAVANLSPFHFHRLFTALTGIPVAKAIQLLRLREASYHLVFTPQRPITDIALDAGFQNAESFSRAFKRKVGQSPSEFRSAPQWRYWLKEMTVPNFGGKTSMQVDIVDFKETRLAAVTHRGDPATLNHSLQKFVQWRKANELGLENATFNIVYDDPDAVPAEEYRFDIGVETEKEIAGNHPGIVQKVIPAGRCAVLRHLGSSDNIGESVTRLYKEWFPTSGEELRDFPLFFHRVKLYPAQVPEHEQVTDIYLPLR
ncbi:AraC family transcriptional regulator [Proteobacteria bacterium 005FR1]|nr:AraC family transcriptional regulator [Proteobacteria bacterium 005FR1]